MNIDSFHGGFIEDHYPGGSSSSSTPPPQPMEGLHEVGPPPFLTKTFDMVADSKTAHIVSWSRGGHSFVVWDVHAFSNNALPTYFKHSNFSSFVRQFNTYGFRKIDPKKWEFANESFLRGQRHLLKNITRRRAALTNPLCVEIGKELEIEQLRKDKRALGAHISKIREQQKEARACLRRMELKLEGTEKKQQQMMRFLARTMRNPDFALQLGQRQGKGVEENITKKRRRPMIEGEGSSGVKMEPLEDVYGFHRVSELEELALEMQGLGRVGKSREVEEIGIMFEKELGDDGFWEELFSEGFGEEDDDDEVDMLADRLGYLGSINPSPN